MGLQELQLNVSLAYGIAYFEFSKIDSWFEISHPKNIQIASFMQIKLYFAISLLEESSILNFDF